MTERTNNINLENIGINKEKKDIQSEKPIFIIYRENDLYRDFVPKLVKKLEEMGKKVEVESFNRDQNIDEIEQKGSVLLPREKRNEIALNTTVIMDNTSAEAVGMWQRQDINLDDLVNQIYSDVYLGKEFNEPSQLENKESTSYSELLNILGGLIEEVRKNYPNLNTIALINNSFDVHDKIKNTDAELLDGLENNLEAFNNWERMNTERKGAHAESREMRILINRLSKLIPTENIIVYDQITDFDNDGHTLVIVDRHHVSDEARLEKAGKYRIILPIASAMEDMAKSGLLNLPEEKIDQKLSEFLESKFGSNGQ